jgi:sugar lactone lactonase YvrE
MPTNGGYAVSRLIAAGFILAFSSAGNAAPVPAHTSAEPFLVQEAEKGIAFLNAEGEEVHRLGGYASNGAFSPNRRMLACLEFDRSVGKMKLVIRPQDQAASAFSMPLAFGQVGGSSALAWSPNSSRLLVSETGFSRAGAVNYSHRSYNLATKEFSDLKLPQGALVTGWSTDGKRYLASVGKDAKTQRLAWINADGLDKLEFITDENEIATGGKLSRDGQKLLFQSTPTPGKGETARTRLYVLDLASGKRFAIDEPGEVSGYCWSPDGSRVAYTWQQSLDRPKESPLREIVLYTADPDGKNRKAVGRRILDVGANNNVVNFFTVLDWR